MLTFSSLIKKLAGEKLCAAGCHLAQPDQPVRNILFHPSFLHQMQEGSICVQYVSEFNRLTAKPAGLYLLISDHILNLNFCPQVENWAVFPQTVGDHLLYVNIRRFLSVSQRVDVATLRLSQSLLRKDTLEEIAAIGEQELGNPIFLSDTSTKVLLFSNMEALLGVNDELIQSVTTHGFVTSEYFDKYDYPTLLAAIEKSAGAFLCHSKFVQKQDRIIVRLTVNGNYFGWIVAFPRFRPFQDGDCEIMDVLAAVLTVELEKKKTDFAFSHRENLLMELMSRQITSSDEFWTRANCLGWTRSNQYQVVVIGFQRQQNAREESQAALSYKNHLALTFPSLRIISIRNQLVLLLETERVEPILQPLQRFLAHYHLSAAVSNYFHDILQFPEHYEQAADILHLGSGISPGKSVYFYRDLYLYHYMSKLNKSGDPVNYYLPAFLTLLHYDQQYHTCYLETMRAYVEHRNVLATASALHIHRNTMNYRLQKIRDITGLDLTEGDNLYKLWFSFILHDLSLNGNR